MSTKLTFAAYKPNEGKAGELREILKAHIPTLRKLELITDNSSYVLESEDGTIIEVFEWTGDEAKDIAHKHPAVRAIWGKMMEICSFPAPKELPESSHSFANFNVIQL